MGRAPPKKKSSNSVVSAWPGLRPRRWSYSNRCLRPRREKSRNSFYESARKRWHRRRQPRYERAISESFAALGDTPMPLYLEDLTAGRHAAADGGSAGNKTFALASRLGHRPVALDHAQSKRRNRHEARKRRLRSMSAGDRAVITRFWKTSSAASPDCRAKDGLACEAQTTSPARMFRSSRRGRIRDRFFDLAGNLLYGFTMTNDRVSAWLDELGLGIYCDSFQQNAIDWDVLPELNEGDLEALGVLLGHRKKLLRAIAQLSQSAEVMGKGSIPISAVLERQPFPPERDQAERRPLTVMFCDLVDSTPLSRHLDPEDLQDVVRRFLDTCSQAIGRFDGYIAKYMGDGMLVYFGYPHAHENDAERAVHSGLAILDAVKALNQDNSNQGFEIAARIGIATGQVVVGELMGQETAKERSVFGKTQSADH